MPNVILATASYDRTIKFWEAPSGICVRTLQFQARGAMGDSTTADVGDLSDGSQKGR